MNVEIARSGKPSRPSRRRLISAGGAAAVLALGPNARAQPAGRVSIVTATERIASIQAKLDAVPAGGTLVFPAMEVPGPLRGKAGITLRADGVVTTAGTFNFDGLAGWTVRGRAPGSGFVFSGRNRIAAHSATNFSVGHCTFVDIEANGFDGSAIAMNRASFGTIVNNDFVRCQGNTLGMYDLDNMTFDGNRFLSCWQPFSLQEPTIPNKLLGRNIQIRRSVFLATQCACIEAGPASNGAEYFSNLVVQENFFDDFDNRSGAETMLAISLVGQAAENTLVADNFIRLGTRPSVAEKKSPAIEFSGTGQCRRNVLWGFHYAGFTYQSGWDVRDNTLHQVKEDFFNNGKGTGTFASNLPATAAPLVPPMPLRLAW